MADDLSWKGREATTEEERVPKKLYMRKREERETIRRLVTGSIDPIECDDFGDITLLDLMRESCKEATEASMSDGTQPRIEYKYLEYSDFMLHLKKTRPHRIPVLACQLRGYPGGDRENRFTEFFGVSIPSEFFQAGKTASTTSDTPGNPPTATDTTAAATQTASEKEWSSGTAEDEFGGSFALNIRKYSKKQSVSTEHHDSDSCPQTGRHTSTSSEPNATGKETFKDSVKSTFGDAFAANLSSKKGHNLF